MLRALGLERFNPNKLKPHLKMSEQRFSIINSKKTNQIKVQKREIAELLKAGKEEKARIRVEHLIRCDFTIEAYELLGLLCELVHERVALIANEKDCPGDMKEAVCTLVWAAQRTEVPELREVARQLELKYGKEFCDAAKTGLDECVNTRVAHKLSISPPSAKIVLNYLSAIAKEYDIDWTPADTGLDDDALATQSMPGPTGFSVPVAPGSNLTQAYSQAPVAEVIGVHAPDPQAAEPKLDDAPTLPTLPDPTVVDHANDIPAAPTTLPSAPSAAPSAPVDEPPPQLPPAVGGSPTAGGDEGGRADDDDEGGTDYDALAKRFENLKK
mmetsp:Transcript_7025/g.18380  ORF Transcript_7025/g.18380 Transcript_7025/m.18380 type:complete len:327 (+) Transcript_7025:54-1034(+)